MTFKTLASFKIRLAKPVVIATFVASVLGCSVGPDYVKPELTVPDKFGEASVVPQETLNEDRLQTWWQTFADPTLNALVSEAMASNLTLQAAESRVRQARALVWASRSDFFPYVNTTGSFSRSRQSANGQSTNSGGSTGGASGTTTDTNGDGTVDTGGSTGSSPTTLSTEPKNLYEAGFDASWEIDLFGGTRRKVEAAEETYDAQLDSQRDVMVSLLAEVAQNYVLLRGSQRELQVGEAKVAAQQETLDLQRLKFTAGLTNDLTVAQSEAQVKSNTASLPPLRTAIRQAIHRLSVLLGKPPLALEELLQAPAGIPKGPPVIPVGIPADLLRRRPDVRQAEHLLAASNANIGAAVAEFFPKLELTGTLGLRSENSGTLFNSASRYWSGGPNLSWNIISWTALISNLELQNAKEEEALFQYKQTVLDALAGVESALVAYDQEQSRYHSLVESVASSNRALDLAKQLNNAGIVDFINVLDAQQTVYVNEDLLVQSERSVSGNLIALYKELGGGWDVTPVPVVAEPVVTAAPVVVSQPGVPVVVVQPAAPVVASTP